MLTDSTSCYTWLHHFPWIEGRLTNLLSFVRLIIHHEVGKVLLQFLRQLRRSEADGLYVVRPHVWPDLMRGCLQALHHGLGEGERVTQMRKIPKLVPVLHVREYFMCLCVCMCVCLSVCVLTLTQSGRYIIGRRVSSCKKQV